MYTQNVREGYRMFKERSKNLTIYFMYLECFISFLSDFSYFYLRLCFSDFCLLWILSHLLWVRGSSNLEILGIIFGHNWFVCVIWFFNAVLFL